MISVNVQGGTGAGKRRPFEGAPIEWACACFVPLARRGKWEVGTRRTNPGYLAACPDCGERRPS